MKVELEEGLILSNKYKKYTEEDTELNSNYVCLRINNEESSVKIETLIKALEMMKVR